MTPTTPATPAVVGDPDAILCTVFRTFAPRAVLWAQHGCPPDPAPLAADRRPCRVLWGSDIMNLGYDAAGRLAEVTHAAIVTKYRYDDDGHLTAIAWRNGSDAMIKISPGEIEVKRDGAAVTYKSELAEQRATLADGKLSSFEIDERHVWTMSRDRRGVLRALSRATEGDSPDAVKFIRDPADLLIKRVDGTYTSSYTWDARARLTGIQGMEVPATVEYVCE